MFEKIKGYYDSGLWSKERIWNVVGKVISEEEYQTIVTQQTATQQTATQQTATQQ